MASAGGGKRVAGVVSGDLGVVADSSNNVSQWTDLSGNGESMFQADSSMFAELATGVMNGQPAIQFNGSSSNVATLATADLLKGANDATIIVVMNPSASQLNSCEIFDASNAAFRVTQNWGATNQYNLLWYDSDWNGFTSNYTITTSGVPQVLDIVKSGLTVNGYVNGTLEDSATFSWASTANFQTGPQTWTIGGEHTANFNGQIAEVLFYNRALSDAEREQVEAALMAKYVPTTTNGIPNSWLMQYLGTLNYSASADPGGVGRTILQSYQQGLSPWPAPIVSSGLQAWYRADLGLVTDASSNVTQWTDISGNGASMVQTNSYMYAQLATGVMNGQPAVQFNGSTSNVATPGVIDLLKGANDATIILVTNPSATQVTSSELFDGGNAMFRVNQNDNTVNQYLLYWNDPNGTGFANTGTSIPSGEPQVLDFVKSGLTVNGYLNGTLVNSTTFSWASTANFQTGPQTWKIGGEQTANFNGQIAEVLFYNRALSDSERGQVEAALMAKYVPTTTNGIPNSWLMQFLGTLSYSASADPGGVGRTILQSYQQGLSPWPTPIVTNGLHAWYRADLGVVQDSNGNVTQWTDLSGTGASVEQSNSAMYPQLASGAMNGNPAVQFNGTSSNLVTPGQVDLFQGSNDATVIVVLDPASTQQTNSVLLDGSNASFRVDQNGGVTNQYQLLWIGADNNIYANTGVNTAVGVPQVLDVIKGGAAISEYLNGTLEDTASLSWSSTPNFQLGPKAWTVGAMSNQLANFNGQIAEILFYNRALTDAERQSIEAALTAKYIGSGIPNSWLLQYFGSTNVNPNADYNGNGLTVAQSYASGFNPVEIFNGSAFSILPRGQGNTYSYDLSGRLIATSYSNGVNIHFTNDQDSNITGVANYGAIVQWRTSEGLPADGTGNGVDTAILGNDGIPNLAKYAFGLDPTGTFVGECPEVSVTNLSGGYLQLTYMRPDPAPADIVYTVQVSGDGINWSSGSGATVNVSTTTNFGTATVVAQDATPVGSPRFRKVHPSGDTADSNAMNHSVTIGKVMDSLIRLMKATLPASGISDASIVHRTIRSRESVRLLFRVIWYEADPCRIWCEGALSAPWEWQQPFFICCSSLQGPMRRSRSNPKQFQLYDTYSGLTQGTVQVTGWDWTTLEWNVLLTLDVDSGVYTIPGGINKGKPAGDFEQGTIWYNLGADQTAPSASGEYLPGTSHVFFVESYGAGQSPPEVFTVPPAPTYYPYIDQDRLPTRAEPVQIATGAEVRRKSLF